MFGVLNIDKPLELTSHDVVARVRRKLGIKKVGHAGTLDPLATGVLPVCVGNATRLIEYFPSDKRYRSWVTFGMATTTWDAEGEAVSSKSAKALEREDVEILLERFIGKVEQVVPPHSAVHHEGKKLYEYARKGIKVPLPTRTIEIFESKLVDFDTSNPDRPVATLDLHTSTGTYVRSIAHEMGELLEYGAYLSKLVRTAHGKFPLEASVTLDEFMDSDNPQMYLQSPADYLPFTQINIAKASFDKLLNGMKLQPADMDLDIRNHMHYLLCYDHQPVAVALGEPKGRLKPLKVFATQQQAAVKA